MTEGAREVVAILWEWTGDTPHSGARFWGCHALESDGRVRDWPAMGLRPVAAAKAVVVEGQGLELLDQMRERGS